jgi:hypothetical protein
MAVRLASLRFMVVVPFRQIIWVAATRRAIADNCGGYVAIDEGLVAKGLGQCVELYQF